MNRTDEALEALQRAVELAPEDPVVRLVLGNTFLEKGDRERAASLFREASELAPSDLDVHVTLYTLFSSMGLEEDAGREERAIRTIQGAPEAEPGQGP
ncbi:MAG: tetratricopeptide repeat protein, partial [Bacillota bacterium]